MKQYISEAYCSKDRQRNSLKRKITSVNNKLAYEIYPPINLFGPCSSLFVRTPAHTMMLTPIHIHKSTHIALAAAESYSHFQTTENSITICRFAHNSFHFLAQPCSFSCLVLIPFACCVNERVGARSITYTLFYICLLKLFVFANSFYVMLCYEQAFHLSLILQPCFFYSIQCFSSSFSYSFALSLR